MQAADTADDRDPHDGDSLADTAGAFAQGVLNLFKTAVKGNDAGGAPFFKAVRANQLEDVRRLLDGGFDPNGHNGDGDTALHIAARGNLVQMTDLLLRRGASPRRGKAGDPAQLPLDEAVNYGRVETAELLTARGGYTGEGRKDGLTLLHRACEKGKPRLVEALLRGGADDAALTPNGQTPFFLALRFLQKDVAHLLLDYPAAAAQINDLYNGEDDRGRSPLHMAAEHGMTHLAAKMIGRGAYINLRDAVGLTPLDYAIMRGDVATVQLLAQAGADVNGDGRHLPPLHRACRRETRNKAEIVAVLLRCGADPDDTDPQNGQTILHSLSGMAGTDSADALRAVLDYPVQLEKPDIAGRTPLLQAVCCKSKSAITLLLASGADPAACDAAGRSARLLARDLALGSGIIAALDAHGAAPATREITSSKMPGNRQ